MKKTILKKLSIFIFFSFVLFYHNKTYAIIYPSNPIWPNSELSDIFPESYKSKINQLKGKHPNWTFKALYTNISWNICLNHQSNTYLSGINTIHDSYSNVWKYNNRNEYADGSFVKASDLAIAYTMDPRNFLTEDKIFQFEYLGFSPNSHTINAVQSVLTGTLMGEAKKNQYKIYGGTWVNLGTTYKELIHHIGKNNKVSPVHIASRIRQETSGDLANNASINGQHPTYRSRYNFFNIKATPDANGLNAVTNGLKYAHSKNWIDPNSSISGGCETIKKYVTRGQNTIYFQKYNTNNDGNASTLLGTGYMTNIMAPSNEATTTYKAFQRAGILNAPFEFHIPVYKNMPKKPSPHPAYADEYKEVDYQIYLKDNDKQISHFSLTDKNNNIILTFPYDSNIQSSDNRYILFQKREYTYNVKDYIEVYDKKTTKTYEGYILSDYIHAYPKELLDTTKAKTNVTYDYQENNNTVLVTIHSNEELRKSKFAPWVFNGDKKSYSRYFDNNISYTTNVQDLVKNITDVDINVTQVDKTGPKVKVTYQMNQDNTVTATITSDEIMKDTKPTWSLSDDKRHYTKTFRGNQNYSTPVEDRFGNISQAKIEISSIRAPYQIEYHYNEINNSVTAKLLSPYGFLDTKPTWELSYDNKTYTKTFTSNQNYQTDITDVYENKNYVTILFHDIDDIPPNLNISYIQNLDNTVTCIVTSNEPLKNDKPTWNLDDTHMISQKTFPNNQNYTTTFSDKHNNKIAVTIKFNTLLALYDISYLVNNETQEVTVKLTSPVGFSNTKPTWKLSSDNKTYEKTFTTNQEYQTDIIDIYGNRNIITIVIDQIQEVIP